MKEVVLIVNPSSGQEKAKIYEKKADHILDLAQENPAQIFSLIKKRIELRLKLLEA